MMRHFVAIFCLLSVNFSLELGIENVTFVIISQDNDYNDKLGKLLEDSLKEQSSQLQLNEPQIYISNKFFKIPADWTITPLIVPLLDAIQEDTRWVIILEDKTSVQIDILLHALKTYDFDKEIWIGHSLHDSDATIIHHFAFHEDPTFFKYPNLGSGIAFSIPLIKRLKSRIEKGFKQLDFHIDPAHEFALLVYEDGKGSMIQNDDRFCAKLRSGCATYPKQFEPCANGDIAVIYFAVKTCHKFHNDRVKAVKDTWYDYASKVTFFSDFEDSTIPTKSLGVPNTEQGHCQKTIAILQYTLQEFDENAEWRWLALVDDDTILSPSRITSLTTCYENTSLPLILGERYRFGTRGFNYPTGGAGILINRAALRVMANACRCPRPDSPDDMVLGACAEENGVVLVHIPQMHQARPEDYAPDFLATDDAVSFHKHWMIDPVKTYEHWFATIDQSNAVESLRIKSEL